MRWEGLAGRAGPLGKEMWNKIKVSKKAFTSLLMLRSARVQLKFTFTFSSFAKNAQICKGRIAWANNLRLLLTLTFQKWMNRADDSHNSAVSSLPCFVDSLDSKRNWKGGDDRKTAERERESCLIDCPDIQPLFFFVARPVEETHIDTTKTAVASQINKVCTQGPMGKVSK